MPPEPSYTLTLTNEADEADRAIISSGLASFNAQFAGPENFEPLTIFVRDADGSILGGMLAATFWRWLYISILWLPDSARGQGLGTRLMAMAEQEAVARGCIHAFVDTLDFQALGFYHKLGYSVWGQLEDFPPGHTRYYLRKDFPA